MFRTTVEQESLANGPPSITTGDVVLRFYCLD